MELAGKWLKIRLDDRLFDLVYSACSDVQHTRKCCASMRKNVSDWFGLAIVCYVVGTDNSVIIEGKIEEMYAFRDANWRLLLLCYEWYVCLSLLPFICIRLILSCSVVLWSSHKIHAVRSQLMEQPVLWTVQNTLLLYDMKFQQEYRSVFMEALGFFNAGRSLSRNGWWTNKMVRTLLLLTALEFWLTNSRVLISVLVCFYSNHQTSSLPSWSICGQLWQIQRTLQIKQL